MGDNNQNENNNDPFNNQALNQLRNDVTSGAAESEHTGSEQPANPQGNQQSQGNAYGAQPQYGQYQQPQYQNNQDSQNPYNQNQYNQNPYNQNQYNQSQNNQNQYNQNGYNQNPYQQYNQYQEQIPPKNNSMAIGSMVCGIIGVLLSCCYYVSLPLAVISIVLGILVLKNKKDGKPLAIVGIVLGSITVLIAVLFIFASFYMVNTGYYNDIMQEYNNILGGDSSIY